MANQSPFGYPDQIKTTIVNSNYLAQSLDTNPFQVRNGFLPTPTSPVSLFQQLNSNALKAFDGNIFSNQPLTVMILLPDAIRPRYDLRLLIKPANMTIYPLDALGRQLNSSTSGYTGRNSIDWSDIALSTLFTTKNAFDDGCGAQLTCGRLNACNGILGCDGFSVPVAQLKSLMPANGYRFQLSYRIGLPNPDGSPASARQLLGMEEPMSSSLRKLLQSTTTTTTTSSSFVGLLAFSLSIDQTTTVVEVPIENQPIGNQPNQQMIETKTKWEAFLISDLVIIVATIILYPLISQCSKDRNSDKYYI